MGSEMCIRDSSQGYPAKVTLTIYIPDNVKNISIDGCEINFKLKMSSGGTTDVFYITKGNVSGSLPTTAGYYKVFVSSNDSSVLIGVVE